MLLIIFYYRPTADTIVINKHNIVVYLYFCFNIDIIYLLIIYTHINNMHFYIIRI